MGRRFRSSLPDRSGNLFHHFAGRDGDRQAVGRGFEDWFRPDPPEPRVLVPMDHHTVGRIGHLKYSLDERYRDVQKALSAWDNRTPPAGR